VDGKPGLRSASPETPIAVTPDPMARCGMRRLTLAVMLLPIVAMLAVAGCGQSVATCASDCALIGGPGAQQNVMSNSVGRNQQYVSCPSTCESDQATATANGRGTDFQALLTCISNSGSFAPECYSLACGETDAFGTPPGCGESDAGGVSPGDDDAGEMHVVGVPDAALDVTVVALTVDASQAFADGGSCEDIGATEMGSCSPDELVCSGAVCETCICQHGLWECFACSPPPPGK
jgi:hypothetical protein